MDKRNLALGAIVVTVAASSLVTALAAWTGATVERQARAQVEALNQAGRLRISDFDHARSLFGAEGHFTLQAGTACGAGGSGEDGLQVQYHVSHLPGWQGPAHVEAVVHLPASAQGVVQMASGDDVLAHLSAHAGWTGGLSADVDSAALTVTAGPNATLKAERSHGHVSSGAQSLQVDWQVPSVNITSLLGSATLAGVSWHASAAGMEHDGGQSQVELALTHGTFGEASLDGLQFTATSHRHEGVVDADARYQLASLAAGAARMRQAHLSYGLQGVDAAALDAVNTALAHTCGLHNLDAATVKALQAGFQRAVARGVQQVLKAGGTFDEGTLDAALTVRLQAPPGNLGGAVRLADQVTLHGELSASSTLAQRVGMPDLVKAGFATQAGALLSTTFDYAARRAKVNGRPADQLPGGDAGQMVVSALDALQRLLGGAAPEEDALPAAPAAALAEPAAAPAAELAEAPALPPGEAEGTKAMVSASH